MENTTMNNVVNEVVETSENIINIEDISKSNIVDAVKSLAVSGKQKFDILEADQVKLEQYIDYNIDKINSLSESVSSLQKNVKELKIGCYGLAGIVGIGFGLGAGLYLSKRSSKKKVEEATENIKE